MLAMEKKPNTVPESRIDYSKCYAKTCPDGSPGTTVFDHCRYSGAVAEVLAKMLPRCVRELLPADIGLCVALHDIGKVSPGFQGKYFKDLMAVYAPEWVRHFENGATNTLHAEVGASALEKYTDSLDTHPLVRAVAAHHGSASQTIRPNTDGGCWQSARVELIHALEADRGGYCDEALASTSDAAMLAGLTCVADWLSSDEQFFNPGAPSLNAETLARQAEDITAHAGFRTYAVRHDLSFRDIFGFAPREEQRALFEMVDAPGVYVMEASMGAGKTEAALYSAYKMLASGQNHGIYFALPTRLTSDRIHERVEKFIRSVFKTSVPVRLSHGQAWLEEFTFGAEDCGNRVPSWFSPSKRGLLYPFAVGTIDQALMAVMNVKHGFVRRFGLAGKVVILDEVHSYDLYTGTLLDMLVKSLRGLGCTVIILSATLTQVRREELLGLHLADASCYPCISSVTQSHPAGRVRFPLASRPPQDVAVRWLPPGEFAAVEDALAKARSGCNVLCIANTVKKAQAWYWQLRQTMTEADNAIKVGLLHSRFPSFRRTEIEDEWMADLGSDSSSRPTGSILIATQIVEQSVDIDADYMVSEIAPVDMLLQRIGRLWRHDRGMRPVDAPVLAIALSGPHPSSDETGVDAYLDCFGRGTSYVYAPFVLEHTYRVLHGRPSISVPQDIRALLEAVYTENNSENAAVEFFRRELHEHCETLRGRALSVSANVLSLPSLSDDDENPPTRYGSQPTVKLLLVSDYDGGVGKGCADISLINGETVSVNHLRKDFGVTKKLYLNLVSVPVSQCGSLRGQPSAASPLARHFFVSEMPWTVKVDSQSGSLVLADSGEDVGLGYRNDLGVYSLKRECVSAESNEEQTAGLDIDFTEERDW